MDGENVMTIANVSRDGVLSGLHRCGGKTKSPFSTAQFGKLAPSREFDGKSQATLDRRVEKLFQVFAFY
jgi:hypothetical protein